MQASIDSLRHEFTQELQNVASSQHLEALKVKYLGKKGPIQNLMKGLKDVAAEQRPSVGKLINDLKEEIALGLSTCEAALIQREESAQLEREKIDITLPGRRRFAGKKHIVVQVMDEMIDILVGMGFSVQYGPDIDTDWYNFEALNFAPDHPARDMQDTFYIAPNVLLRTHTSNVQVRVMETQKPPIRVIAPGKAYRNETITARSHVFFHQLEGFYIDKGVTFADLFATMQEFLGKLFKTDVEIRFRPSYFPFVEPGMEVDLRCLTCNGSGCGLCKYTGWLEIAGTGMIHPEVLKNGAIDPEIYTGYAWGMGIERMVLLKHSVKDIRLFTENDVRFLISFSDLLTTFVRGFVKQEWIVTQEESGLKLVDFLKRHLDSKTSARQIKKWVENNACTLNGRTERFASAIVGKGDKIALMSIDRQDSFSIDRSLVLFEDSDLFIINKPSGVASDDPQFLTALHRLSPALLLIHRLDKETSGALMFAKSTTMREKMIQLFRQKKINKTYLALVDGVPSQKSGIIDNYLGKVHSYQGQALWGSVDAKQGQHARTEWVLHNAGTSESLLICKPITGRTHQIRVHLSGMGHPILGDYQYGRRFRSAHRPKRCMLHAYGLSFVHPRTGSELNVEAPVPDDMQEMIGNR